MSASAAERGISPEIKEQEKAFGRVVIVDYPGEARDTITTAVSQYAATIESYDTVETALDGIEGEGEDIAVIISGYSVSDFKKRTGVDIIRAAKGKYPKTRAILVSTIPDLIGKTAEVRSVDATLVAKGDPTKPDGKVELRKRMTEALFGKDVLL